VSDCAFCRIIAGDGHAERLRGWPDAIVFTPLNPVTPGHVLVVPKVHVPHALADPAVTGLTMQRASEYAQDAGHCNLITSVGSAATQTIRHLHIHIVPRRPDDGLALPWTAEA
jgi:histidine triad (HIT) family protein